jgi:hypothetical protein
VNRWWSDVGGEHYWLEITDRSDLGADLNAPEANELGNPQWSYDLIREAADGDVVFHFSKDAESIVGYSFVRDEPWRSEVVWGAKGASARGLEVTPYARPGWRRALQHFTRLSDPVSLDHVRSLEPAVFAVRSDLEAVFGNPIYFPFVPYSGQPLRTFQGYMVKMPAALVELVGLPAVPALPTSDDVLLVGGSDDQPAEAPQRGAAYRPADAAVAVERGEPQPVDPALYERGLRSHRELQNLLAGAVAEAGFVPLSPGAADPDWDLAWHDGERFVVVEVKSLSARNEERQLRLGLGQVLRYRQHLSGAGDVAAVLVVERPPKDATWVGLCTSVQVELTWPAKWASLLGSQA